MITSLQDYDEDGNIDQTSIVLIIDGGAEGFEKVHMLFYLLNSTLELYPLQIIEIDSIGKKIYLMEIWMVQSF